MMKAEDIKRFDNWTCLIYSEPGKGKTSMVKSLKGKTVLLSVDGMYHVLSQQKDIVIQVMDPDKPNQDLGDFYRFLTKHKDEYDNIVIDNLSTFQKYWLNARAVETRSGQPEIKDYGVVNRILFDFIASLKQLEKNVLIFAHEKKVDVEMDSGRAYTQFQPDIRNLDAIMGIIPIVGRLVIAKSEENQETERIIVLQPTQSTRAKDQLISDTQTIGQMELIPKLQQQS
ncbi:AAA family ATPase [Tetragenococcus halophilus]|nr:AAA family ATPase [Tetragenococcus halophilus]